MWPSFNLFGREVYTYNVCVGLGAIVALLVLQRLGRKRDFDRYVVEAALWAAVPAVVGGVLLYGCTNIEYIVSVFRNMGTYANAVDFLRALLPAFSGSVFYGGCFGAIFGVWLWARRHMPDRTGDILDLCAVGIPLFHSFGRVGCFLGGCCFGIPCEIGIMSTHSPLAIANGVTRFPVQLLEAALEFCLFILICKLYRQNRLRGRLLAVWACTYACVRFFDEFLRGDMYRGFLGPLSTSQWISLLILLVVIVLETRRRLKKAGC